MLSEDEKIALKRWIRNWKKTYGENPSQVECLTWMEWQSNGIRLSETKKKLIIKLLEIYLN